MDLTYTSYLKIEELLNLQEFQSELKEHDEMLFIIIHQAYELWFKQILHELNHVIYNLKANELAKAYKTMHRIKTIMKVIIQQFDILETMTPLEFLSFRNYLQSASGFQSYQFREFEFMFGIKSPNVPDRFNFNIKIKERLELLYNEPTFWDIFVKFLALNSFEIPDSVIERDYSQPIIPNEELQKILIDIYRNDPFIAQFCEIMVDLDELIQEWRYKHVKMVERTIGAKIGTGGSSGVEYLKQSLFKPVFPDLWLIRSEF